MIIAKTFTYNEGQDMKTNIRRLEQDLSNIFNALQGRLRVGENIDESGLSTTQTFKDGSGATKTMTIVNGRITAIA